MISNLCLEDYTKRSGDEEIYTNNLIANEHGFASYEIRDKTLVLLNVYGNGRFWDAFFETLAREKELKKIQFATRRSFRAFERKFGYKRIGYVLEKEV